MLRRDDPPPLEVFLEGLYGRRSRAIKLGLDTVEALLEALGNPQEAVPAIHVAGTNGKGSVCAMLHAILTEAGWNVGLYTSPHLVRFNERIVMGRDEIGDGELLLLLKEIDRVSDSVAARPSSRQPTFFEFVTAAAFTAFQRNEVDYAVLETGLGGRLDATNVLDPLVSVITRVDIDHVSYLGGDVASIAHEKAGIIKPGCPVVCSAQHPDAVGVIEKAAAARNAPYISATDTVSVVRKGLDLLIKTPTEFYPPIRVPIQSPAQLENVASAVAAAEILRDYHGVSIPVEAVVQGLASVRWLGRGQFLQKNPPVLLDVAHNPSGAVSLVALLDEVLRDRRIGLVAGFSEEKDAVGILRILAPRVDVCWIVELSEPNTMSCDDACMAAQQVGLRPRTSHLPEAIQSAKAWAVANQGAVCITGSVYLGGDVLAGCMPLGEWDDARCSRD